MEFPSYCFSCGAALMGGATKHAPDCVLVRDGLVAGEVLPDVERMCGRCYDEDVDVFPANCAEKPEALKGAPLGMYHCPDCGAMVIAGVEHPPLCQRCLDRQHPGFDAPPPGFTHLAAVVREATPEEQRAAIVDWARQAVAQGAGHDCEEWWTDGRCAVCDRLKPHEDER